MQSLGMLIEFGAKVGGTIFRHGEPSQTCPREFSELFPLLLLESLIYSTGSFIIEDLLHPEACRRTVQKPQKRGVLAIVCSNRQFDDWGRLLIDCALTIQDKVIVRGDKGEDDRESYLGTGNWDLAILVPRLPGPEVCLSAKDDSVSKFSSVRPRGIGQFLGQCRGRECLYCRRREK